MITIIAEKRDVGRKIAQVVGATTDKRGWYEGNGYAVSWARGHLLEISVPEADGEWKLSKLPILPEKFRRIPRTIKTKNGSKITDKDCEERLFCLRNLIQRSDWIINAGDPGMEGEVIQREIYEHLNVNIPVYRMWTSSMEPSAIRDALMHLKPQSDYDTLYLAGKARQEADWMVGINGTMAFTLGVGSDSTLSLGRVQTPTLAMICRRYIENENFVPEDYWKIILKMNCEDKNFAVASPAFKDREEFERLLQEVSANPAAHVDLFSDERRKQSPPLLFNLTELEKTASRRHGLIPKKTDELLQDLYMSGLVSYPRTPSKHITEEDFKTVPRLLKELSSHPTLGAHAAAIQTPNAHCVDKVKVTDHSALMITGAKPGELNEQHRLIYDLICERMIEAFSPDCEKAVRKVEMTCCGVPFKASDTVILYPGWKAVRGTRAEAAEKEEESEGGIPDDEFTSSLPVLTEGQTLTAYETREKKGVTTPPPIYTMASILTAMESAGRTTSEMLQKGLQKGLGTPATRSETLELLQRREYVTLTGGKLLPTVLGLKIYVKVKEMEIADPIMTEKWENALDAIIDRRVTVDTFDKEIRKYTAKLTSEIAMREENEDIRGALEREMIKCPNCGQMNRTRDKGYFCKKCDFKIFRMVAKKKLTDRQIKNLIEVGETEEITGFRKQDGTTFKARLTRKGDKVTFKRKED